MKISEKTKENELIGKLSARYDVRELSVEILQFCTAEVKQRKRGSFLPEKERPYGTE